MWKLTALLLIVVVPTISGSFVLIPMTFFGVADYSFWLLVAFAGMGVLVAVPLSVLIARRILRQSGEKEQSTP